MKLYIYSDRPVSEVQKEFNKQYAYLRLEFDTGNNKHPSEQRHGKIPLPVGNTTTEQAAVVEISDHMLVRDVKKIFTEKLGREAQIFRKSGNLWLETTMTSHWTLKQQNDHGREISENGTMDSLDGFIP